MSYNKTELSTALHNLQKRTIGLANIHGHIEMVVEENDYTLSVTLYEIA